MTAVSPHHFYTLQNSFVVSAHVEEEVKMNK